MRSTGQCNTACSLSAGVWKPKVFRLVASLAHPGGNVTALSFQAIDAAGKRLELLRDVVPKLGRLGILFDGGTATAVQEKGEVQALAHALGLEAVPQEIRRAEDIASALDAFKGKADALYVAETALTLRFGGADVPSEQRLADLESSLAQVKLVVRGAALACWARDVVEGVTGS